MPNGITNKEWISYGKENHPNRMLYTVIRSVQTGTRFKCAVWFTVYRTECKVTISLFMSYYIC